MLLSISCGRRAVVLLLTPIDVQHRSFLPICLCRRRHVLVAAEGRHCSASVATVAKSQAGQCDVDEVGVLHLFDSAAGTTTSRSSSFVFLILTVVITPKLLRQPH